MSSDRPLAALPLVAIAVPVLNEEHYIADCSASLLTQGDGYRLEVLVLDGGSTDRTREIVAGIQLRHPEVRLLHNPARLQSAAVNQAAREASPEARILLRADAHALVSAGLRHPRLPVPRGADRPLRRRHLRGGADEDGRPCRDAAGHRAGAEQQARQWRLGAPRGRRLGLGGPWPPRRLQPRLLPLHRRL
ncbi:glycosyltransferase [Teichococcus aestuarii]|uniref:glycosyltransferase n=1 Tax=Teichococcus aestuarii TaxID=568898 RepID=UPI00362007F0